MVLNDFEAEELSKYFFEAGQLKMVKRSGWWVAKIRDPESVAEHSYRTAIIAYVLAKLEGENAEKLCSAGVFHDVLETRILDKHKISSNYSKVSKEIEEKVILDQCERLPEALRNDFLGIVLNFSEKEKKILKDADYLECAFSAKEYSDIGFKDALDWIARIEQVLKTDSAKLLLKKLKKMDSNLWWQGLKEPVSKLK
jgi:putative hydrolase of HD superfamily